MADQFDLVGTGKIRKCIGLFKAPAIVLRTDALRQGLAVLGRLHGKCVVLEAGDDTLWLRWLLPDPVRFGLRAATLPALNSVERPLPSGPGERIGKRPIPITLART